MEKEDKGNSPQKQQKQRNSNGGQRPKLAKSTKTQPYKLLRAKKKIEIYEKEKIDTSGTIRKNSQKMKKPVLGRPLDRARNQKEHRVISTLLNTINCIEENHSSPLWRSQCHKEEEIGHVKDGGLRKGKVFLMFFKYIRVWIETRSDTM